jgi:hypothetical protein
VELCLRLQPAEQLLANEEKSHPVGRIMVVSVDAETLLDIPFLPGEP